MLRIVAGLLALVATLLVSVASAETPPTRAVTPAEFAAELAALRGQVVMLNVWATWCVPCLKEIPDLVSIAEELRPKGFVLLGLSVDEPGDAGRVEAFRQKYFPAFHSLLRNSPDMDSAVSGIDPAWNEIVPTTYIIGRDGRVVRRIQGKQPRAEFRALANEALGN